MRYFRRSATVATLIFVFMSLGSASMILQPQPREIDFNALINDRLDKFIAVLKEEIPNASDQIIGFLEAGRAGLAAGQTQPMQQSLGVTASITLSLSEAGLLKALQVERIRFAATLVADAVLLAFPQENLTVSLGLYVAGDQERIAGPFLGDCATKINVTLPSGSKDFELKSCVSTLPSSDSE